MKAAVWSEMEVDLPAQEMWAVYSSPDLPRLIVDLMPTRYKKIDVLEGDGTQGTVLGITLQPSNKGPLTWHEKFVILDDATMTKAVRQVKGGFLDLGFTFYENIFQITPRSANSCTVRATASFDVKEDSQANASLVTASWGMARIVRDYVKSQKEAK